MEPKFFMCIVLSAFALLFFSLCAFFSVRWTKTNNPDHGFAAVLCAVAAMAMLVWAGISVGLKFPTN
jgi:hypothetical protein